MAELLIMGEALVEIMRKKQDVKLGEMGTFKGPFPGGPPAICASAAARLGCSTALISGVGEDEFGRCILKRLEKDGVDISHVLTDKRRPTGCAFVSSFSDGTKKVIFHIEDSPAAIVPAPPEDFCRDVKILHIFGSSLMAGEHFCGELLKTLKRLSEAGTEISFDPNLRPELWKDGSFAGILEEIMADTGIFLPGREELLAITGEKEVKKAVEKAFAYPKMRVLLLKQGAKGSVLYIRGGESLEFGTYRLDRKDIDPSGSAECFDGAFLASLINGESMIYSVSIASAAGALNDAAFGPMEAEISKKMVSHLIGKAKKSLVRHAKK